MACFYRASVEEFLAQNDQQILAILEVAYAKRGYTNQYTDQTLTWEKDIRLLRQTLNQCVDQSNSAKQWGLLLEFSIPRKEARIDAVLLIGDAIVVLEAKTGTLGLPAKRQLEEYALLLHYFHKASADHRIVPILISSDIDQPNLNPLNQCELFPQLPSYWVAPVTRCSWVELARILTTIGDSGLIQAHASTWDDSPYFPVPSIMEAALALRSGLSIREIAHSEASELEIAKVIETIQTFICDARRQKHHAICFVTGVPGSGKTLVGLGLAHSPENQNEAIHFMSGNGPLVKVLQHLFKQESQRRGTSSPQAKAEAKTLIENVHVFASYYTKDNLTAPSNHAIIFDEAQRAWNKTQNLRKFKRNYSEPEMLLRIMERHEDWAMVIALVGGGQEINNGEAGLEEWGRALTANSKDWIIYASPEVLEGGASTAGHRLFDGSEAGARVKTNENLHLRTSNRSLRSEHLATWVNRVLDGDAKRAASMQITERFPVFLSRDLDKTRAKLREQNRGADRSGLVGSSQAERLRAEGLEPNSAFHADYPWEHWYLADQTDVRSSYACEVFATEFEIQGLELDWIGICWGGDFIWKDPDGWTVRKFWKGSATKWATIKSDEKRNYRRNAYRVLLTRARKGMVIFVPKGAPDDPTRDPLEFESTARYLVRCGVTPLD